MPTPVKARSPLSKQIRRYRVLGCAVLAAACLLAGLPPVGAGVIFERTSPYHHVLVLDTGGVRTLSFDGSQETRMSLRNPLLGHFDYTEMFHLAWLWNTNIQRVLMIGLGGGSTQRSFLHYYPKVTIDSVDLDPVVVNVATNLFFVPVSERHRIHLADGRVYLRRAKRDYDLIVLDAYISNRYGSYIPPHLVTRQFVELARDHLGPDGVLAYNVIGTLQGWKSDLVAALVRTLNEVFPVVYYAPAATSKNVVLLACRSSKIMTGPRLQARASQLIRQRIITLPTFFQRMNALRQVPVPPNRTPVLTDDHAPVEKLAE